MTHKLLLKTPRIFLPLLVLCLSSGVCAYGAQLAHIFDGKDLTTHSTVIPDPAGARLVAEIDSKLFLTTKLDEKTVSESEYLGTFHTEIEVQKLNLGMFSFKIKMQFDFPAFKDKPGVSPSTSTVLKFELFPKDFGKMETDEFKDMINRSVVVAFKKAVFVEAEKYHANYDPVFKENFGVKITHYTQTLFRDFPHQIRRLVEAYPEAVSKLSAQLSK